MSSLYILEIKHLSEISLANMFSHMVGSLFILMLFSLAMQKLFDFDEVPFVLSYVCLALGDKSVKVLLREISEIFPPMFSSRTLMVSQVIFKSLSTLNLFLCMM